jgi:hypothetical protein
VAREGADWFSTVATDLFASCFAAVLIIDSVTPKELGSSVRPVPIEETRVEGTCLPRGAVVVSFDDRSGRRHSTLTIEGHWSPDGPNCRFVGVVSGLTDEPIVNLALTLGVYPTAEEEALRVTVRTPRGECRLSVQKQEQREPC